MDRYAQEPEAGLLVALISSLEHKAVVDIGPEHGGFVEQMLLTGADVHVIRTESTSRQQLAERYGAEPRVTVHEPIEGQGRSVGSLVADGRLPKRIGVLRIAGTDGDVGPLAAIGELTCDIVLVERPSDLPRSRADEIAAALRLEGFLHFALVGRQSGAPFVQWNDVDAPAGSVGLLVFVHARVLGRTAAVTLEYASGLAEGRAGLGERDPALENRQLEAIGALRRIVDLQAAAADDRLEAIEELLEALRAVTHERDLQAKAAAERLAVLERLEREREQHPEAVEKQG